MQAIGNIYEIRGGRSDNPSLQREGEAINVGGAWIQTAGSVVSLLAQLKEEDS